MSFSSVCITEGAPGFPTHWVIFTQNLRIIDVQLGCVQFRVFRQALTRVLDYSCRKQHMRNSSVGTGEILVSHINFPWKPQRPQPKEKMCVGFRNKQVTLDAVAGFVEWSLALCYDSAWFLEAYPSSRLIFFPQVFFFFFNTQSTSYNAGITWFLALHLTALQIYISKAKNIHQF